MTVVEVRFTEDHLWARVEEDGTVLVGLSDYAQRSLGEIAHIDTPEIGQTVNAGEDLASIEAESGTVEVNAPVTGTLVEVNALLEDEPGIVNDSPLDDGWLCRFEAEDVDLEVLDELMDEDAYEEFLSEL